jgi:uncharacterized protein with GYD domain
MPAYVTLFNFTDQGIRNVKQTAERAKAVRAAFEAAGGSIVGIWWTLGQYDGVLVGVAPDDETAIRLAMAIGMQGNVRTTTLRAFGEEEIESIVQGLP